MSATATPAEPTDRAGKARIESSIWPDLWPVCILLIAYSLVLAIITGNIGFFGDDWSDLGRIYRHDFLDAFAKQMSASPRPVYSLYIILMFRTFGFDSVAFHFGSLILLGAGSVLMGWALLNAFPSRRSFARASVLFAFLLPTISTITYTKHTDPGRLCNVFFWLSVVGFQKWALGRRTAGGLIFPVVAYVLCNLAYESASLLIVAVPLLVYPVLVRGIKKDQGSWNTSFKSGRDALGWGTVGCFALGVILWISTPTLATEITEYVYYSDSGIWKSMFDGLGTWPIEQYQWKGEKVLRNLVGLGIFLLIFIFTMQWARRLPRDSAHHSLLRLMSSGTLAFVLLLLARLVGFGGGHPSINGTLRTVVRFYTDLSAPAYFLAAPFLDIHKGDVWAYTLGIGMFALSWILMMDKRRGHSTGGNYEGVSYVLLIGILIYVLGMLPFAMASYGIGQNFYLSGRIFTTSSYGLAIVLGLGSWALGQKIKHPLTHVAAAVVLGCFSCFQVGLRRDWQEATRKNCEIWTSFLSSVPNIAPGTTLLFLDLEHSIGNRAVVFSGAGAVVDFVRLLYGQTNVNGLFLYPHQVAPPGTKESRMLVSPRGIFHPGWESHPSPILLDRLLIAERRGSRLVVLDQLSAEERKADLRWEGVSSLHSNMDLIRPSPQPGAERLRELGFSCPQGSIS